MVTHCCKRPGRDSNINGTKRDEKTELREGGRNLIILDINPCNSASAQGSIVVQTLIRPKSGQSLKQ
jgi:hypothetical protein